MIPRQTDPETHKDAHTVAEDVVPSARMLGPQGSADAEEQARGQVEEGGRGCQHSLDGPDELLGLEGGR